MRAVILILVLWGNVSCTPNSHGVEADQAVAHSEQKVQRTLEEHRDAILAMPGVAGVGLGLCGDDLCIRVLATEVSPALEEGVAALVGSVPYVIEQTGPVRPLPATPD